MQDSPLGKVRQRTRCVYTSNSGCCLSHAKWFARLSLGLSSKAIVVRQRHLNNLHSLALVQCRASWSPPAKSQAESPLNFEFCPNAYLASLPGGHRTELHLTIVNGVRGIWMRCRFALRVRCGFGLAGVRHFRFKPGVDAGGKGGLCSQNKRSETTKPCGICIRLQQRQDTRLTAETPFARLTPTVSFRLLEVGDTVL